jgi:anti-sigma B factor antagonist
MPRRSRRDGLSCAAGQLVKRREDGWLEGLLSRGASDRLVRRDYAVAIRLGGVWLLPARRSVLMQLKITKKTIDGILVFECNGRVVFGEESSLLREQVKSAIPDSKRIVLNLGEVNYIDSGGLGTLVALHTTGLNAGTTIKLANLTKRVGDLLQVTKLLTVFDVCSSESEAIESFRKVA